MVVPSGPKRCYSRSLDFDESFREDAVVTVYAARRRSASGGFGRVLELRSIRECVESGGSHANRCERNAGHSATRMLAFQIQHRLSGMASLWIDSRKCMIR